MTPRELFDGRISEQARKEDVQRQINTAYRFRITGAQGGTWIVDLRAASAGVREGDEDVPCTITMSDTSFVSVLEGRLGVQWAFMQGKLKVSGDVGAALKLRDFLQG